jgi:prepilin-type N-terminal cleavage/methylation domain-containing protein
MSCLPIIEAYDIMNPMKKGIKTAFTLIELLVVIAIIGILSGLIVVTMSGVTQKATIAKGQVFSNSLKNALMLNLVSEWKFDGSGVSDGGNATTVYTQDSWSGGNNCSIGGSPLVYSGTNCVYGSCLKFDGVDDYLNCGNGDSLNMGLNSWTVAVWAKFGNKTAQQFFIAKGIAAGRWLLFYSNNTISANFYNGSGYDYWMATSRIVNDGFWHYVVWTVNRSSSQLLYLDAKLEIGPASVSSGSSQNVTNASSFLVGQYVNFFEGYLDELRIYNVAMPTSQIKEEYYAGLNALYTKGEITGEEYISRINE